MSSIVHSEPTAAPPAATLEARCVPPHVRSYRARSC